MLTEVFSLFFPFLSCPCAPRFDVFSGTCFPLGVVMLDLLSFIRWGSYRHMVGAFELNSLFPTWLWCVGQLLDDKGQIGGFGSLTICWVDLEESVKVLWFVFDRCQDVSVADMLDEKMALVR